MAKLMDPERRIYYVLKVGHVDDRAFKDRTAHNARALARGCGRPYVTRELECGRSPVVCRDEVHQLAIERVERTEGPVAQSSRAFDNRIKHRLNVRRRAGDDLKDLARRD